MRKEQPPSTTSLTTTILMTSNPTILRKSRLNLAVKRTAEALRATFPSALVARPTKSVKFTKKMADLATDSRRVATPRRRLPTAQCPPSCSSPRATKCSCRTARAAISTPTKGPGMRRAGTTQRGRVPAMMMTLIRHSTRGTNTTISRTTNSMVAIRRSTRRKADSLSLFNTKEWLASKWLSFRQRTLKPTLWLRTSINIWGAGSILGGIGAPSARRHHFWLSGCKLQFLRFWRTSPNQKQNLVCRAETWTVYYSACCLYLIRVKKSTIQDTRPIR